MVGVAETKAQAGDIGKTAPKDQGSRGKKALPGLEAWAQEDRDGVVSYSSGELPSYVVPLIDDDDTIA